jgi:hypothetical protein
MRTRSILLVAGVLMMSLAPIGSGQASAAAKIYDFTTIAGLATHSGSADGTNSDARFDSPNRVALDSGGNLYVGDWGNHTIRKVTPVGTNWVVSTIAGAAGVSGAADGTNNAAQFYNPAGVAVDTNGNLYVADTYNHTIRKVTPVGTNWVTTTIAGTATNSGSADGTNNAARFYRPYGVAVDTNGNLYVADTWNHIIRKVTPVGTNWVTTTIAGAAGFPGAADGTNSVAQFYLPAGVAVDGGGNVYVADAQNHTIRKVTPVGTNLSAAADWVTTTIAGSALTSGSADGTNSDALFRWPFGITADSIGNLYVADVDNDTIRKIVPVGTNWVVSTIAGLAGNSGSADGTGSAARFYGPSGVAVDSDGNVYVADSYNRTIRQGVPWGTLTITKETAKLNFAKTNSDSCTLTCTLTLEPGFSVTNKAVTVDIGGAQASFTLDAKGRGTSPPNTCKLSYKKKTGPWTFTTTLKNGSWATQWEAYGLRYAPTPKAGVTVTLPVVLVIGDEPFYGEKALLYKTKVVTSGGAK